MTESTPLRLLLLEDNGADAELTLRELRRAGFEPAGPRVETEAEFLSQLDAEWDLILADYHLPQFDALRALAHVTARRLDVPFIMVSGHVGEEVAVEALHRGAADYLLKDRLGRLGAAVRRALEQRRQDRERREAEVALRASEARLAEAQRLAHIGSWDWHIASGRVDCSEELLRILGITPEGISHYYDQLLDRVAPVDRASLEEFTQRAAALGEAFDCVHGIVRSDGTERIVHTRGTLMRDDGGRPVRVLGTTQDVTESKQAEAKLQASEEQFRLLFATNPHPMWVYDPETLVFLAVNDAAVAHYGYSHEEFRSMTIAEIQAQDEPPAIFFDIAGDRPPRRSVQEKRHRAKDGRCFEVEITAHGLTFAGRAAVLVVAQDVTERLELERQLAHRAFHDPLTNLPNRTRFVERLEAALAAPDGRVAVLFLDLDGFKLVNDSFGHIAGDRLLVAVCQRLMACLGPDVTLARFGGDEFTVLLPDVDTTRQAAALAERIIDRLRAPFLLEGREVYARASVGVVLSSPALPCPSDLLRAADIALYQAKAAGRSTYRVFDPGMAEAALGRMELESDVRRAAERGQLRLFYQPEIDLQTGAIVGAEALVRWQHPRRGLLSAGAFIPLAEESDAILPIGEWVIEEACRTLGAWQRDGAASTHLVMAVNVAPRQLRDPSFPGLIAQQLNRHGLAPHHLKLEITERIVIDDADGKTGVLQTLRRSGLRLALDDFGTGYSSLGYLRRWPVDTIKVDRSFVADLEGDPSNRHLVEVMADLARALGMDVTAEGIETPGQLAWLRTMPIARGQGYHFAPPLPAEEFARLLSQSSRCLVPA